MFFATSLALLMFAVSSSWIKGETYDVKASLNFSDIPGDNSVISTYDVIILDEKIPVPLEDVDSFKVEIILASGYSITRVLSEWDETIVESASGSARMKAILLKVTLISSTPSFSSRLNRLMSVDRSKFLSRGIQH